MAMAAMAETMAATTTDAAAGPRRSGSSTGSLAAFFVLLALLAVQVRAGGDPALGAPSSRRPSRPRRRGG